MTLSSAALACSAAVLLALAAPAADPARPAGKLWVYVGTYTGKASKGIYRFDFDPATGELSNKALVAETVNPTFLALHPAGKYLYAVNEVGEFMGQKAGSVSAFAVDPKTGDLTLLNRESAGGPGPCHVVVDRAGRNVLVANYTGGSAAVLPVAADGKLGPPSDVEQHKGSSVVKGRQEGPHAHSVNLDAANRFAFVADLGLDQVLVYKFDGQKGALSANDPPFAALKPGAGPRHFAFHPDGKHAYAINEIDSTITLFEYDPARGVLTPKQTVSTLPEGGKKGNSTAEVVVHPSGKFVYGSNRGHNSIAIFRVDAKTGELTAAGHATEGVRTPRNFNIDPSGQWLLVGSQSGDSIVVFRIDSATGDLKATGRPVEVGAPVCLKFLAKAD